MERIQFDPCWKIDIEDINNCVPVKKVVVGFAAREALLKVHLSEAALQEFKFYSMSCYKAMVSKLKERYTQESLSFINQLSSLNPLYIVNHPNSTVIKFENLLMTLTSKHYFVPEQCETFLKKYIEVIKRIRLECKEDCLVYSNPIRGIRLDKFFLNLIGYDKDYSDL